MFLKGLNVSQTDQDRGTIFVRSVYSANERPRPGNFSCCCRRTLEWTADKTPQHQTIAGQHKEKQSSRSTKPDQVPKAVPSTVRESKTPAALYCGLNVASRVPDPPLLPFKLILRFCFSQKRQRRSFCTPLWRTQCPEAAGSGVPLGTYTWTAFTVLCFICSSHYLIIHKYLNQKKTPAVTEVTQVGWPRIPSQPWQTGTNLSRH